MWRTQSYCGVQYLRRKGSISTHATFTTCKANYLIRKFGIIKQMCSLKYFFQNRLLSPQHPRTSPYFFWGGRDASGGWQDGSLGFHAESAAPVTPPQISGIKWMVGCSLRHKLFTSCKAGQLLALGLKHCQYFTAYTLRLCCQFLHIFFGSMRFLGFFYYYFFFSLVIVFTPLSSFKSPCKKCWSISHLVPREPCSSWSFEPQITIKHSEVM